MPYKSFACNSGGTGATIKSSYKGILCYPFIEPMVYRGMIGWYKVDEGGGLVLLNSAPASALKLPNVDIVVPGSNFWGSFPGFGYWDGSATRAWKTFSLITAFPDGTGTVICFGREKHGVQDDRVGWKVIMSQFQSNDSYSWINNRINRNAKLGSVGSVIWLGPPPTPYYNTRFVDVFIHNGLTNDWRTKFTNTGWMTQVVSNTTNHFGYETLIYFGTSTDAWMKWKGILGDIMIFNTVLTDAEINQIISILGPRWGF